MCCPSRFNVITPQKSCWRFTSTLAWTLMCFYHWQIQAYKGDHVAEDYTTGVMRDYVNPAVGYLSVTLFMFVQFKFVRKLIVHSICCCFPIASRVTLCKLTTLYFAWSLAGLGCVFMGLPMSTTTIDKKFILWNGGPNQCTAKPFDPPQAGCGGPRWTRLLHGRRGRRLRSLQHETVLWRNWQHVDGRQRCVTAGHSERLPVLLQTGLRRRHVCEQVGHPSRRLQAVLQGHHVY